MLSTALALALAAAPAPPIGAGACSLFNLGACANAGALIQDAGFQAALKAFVGQRRTAYLTPGGQAYGEAMTALGGPAEPVRRLRSLYVFTACADASCADQGAVVLRPDGELVAVAILHSDCNGLRRAGDCVNTKVLSILRGGDDDLSVIETLSDWARRGLADQPIASGAPIPVLDRVEVVVLAGEDHAKPSAPPVTLEPRFQVRPEPAPPLRPAAPAILQPTPRPSLAPPLIGPPAPPTPVTPRLPDIPLPAPAAPQAPADDGQSTTVEAVEAVAPRMAPFIPVPRTVYRTLITVEPDIVLLPPPPPPPPKRDDGWKWHWRPVGR